MPAPFLTPNLLCVLGRRKSRSITRTFLPIRLRAMAVAKAQEDLPSPCLALVNIRLRGRPWDDTSMSDERSDEKVSDIRLFGSRTSCSIAKPSCIFGMARSEEHTSELQSLMRNSYA